MRKKPILEGLFPATKASILAAVLLRRDQAWYLSSLAKEIGTTPSALQRDLALLVAAGILSERIDGNRKYFWANEDSPVFEDLRRIFEKTRGIPALLLQELGTLSKAVSVAFIFGSVATGRQGNASDVDLLIVGSVSLSEMVPMIRRAEAASGREVNPVIFSLNEFRRKMRAGDHFLTGVLRGPKEYLIGDDDAVAAIVGSRRR